MIRLGPTTLTQWYWLVGNRSGPDNIFSAAEAAYVASTDAGYEAFVAGGNAATPIPTDGELGHVLMTLNAPAALITAALGGAPTWGETGALVPAPWIAATLMAAGCTVTSTATASLDGLYALSAQGQSFVTSETVNIQVTGAGIPANGTFTNGTNSKPWLDANGNAHVFNPTQFISMAEKLAAAVDAIVVGATTPQTATIP